MQCLHSQLSDCAFLKRLSLYLQSLVLDRQISKKCTVVQDTPPRSAAHSLFFFHYARRLPALMARPDFEGERAADLLLWLVRSAVGSLGRGAVHDAELALLLRALCHTGQATKFGFRSNALPADMGK